jgi:DNA polymerase-3 subunit epsilon
VILQNPIVVFDVETTGVNKDSSKITQIAALKLWPGDDIEARIADWQVLLQETRDTFSEDERVICTIINPEMQVDPYVLELTHLTQERLNNALPFGAWADYLLFFFSNTVHPETGVEYDIVDLAGYNNAKFDNDMLMAEFNRVKKPLDMSHRTTVDAMKIFYAKEPRTLDAAYTKYVGGKLENAHSAFADVLATLQVLEGQLKMYTDITPTPAGIADFCRDPNWVDDAGCFIWQNDEVCINFSKHLGTPLSIMASTQPGFLRWMISNQFDASAKDVAKQALQGIYPRKKEK